MKRLYKYSLTSMLLLLATGLLSGCEVGGVLDPKGVMAAQEKDLIFIALGLMLIVVIPVFIMTFLFAYKYRASRPNEKYTPDWEHNNWLEFIWWLIPCIIIAILGTITWKTTHELDPYKPLVSNVEPIEVDVVSLDWKWLFIYPKENIATVNYLAIPANTPVNFKITADSPMNGFWIPQLAGQIYAMQGMQTQLHIMATENGDYTGRGATFTGPGFSDMHFIVHVTDDADYQSWLSQVKSSNAEQLSTQRYIELARPSEKDPVTSFNGVADNLFDDIMMKFMMPMDNMVDHNSVTNN